MSRRDLLSTCAAGALAAVDLALWAAGTMALGACAITGGIVVLVLATPTIPAAELAEAAASVRGDSGSHMLGLAVLSVLPLPFLLPRRIRVAVSRARAVRDGSIGMAAAFKGLGARGRLDTARHEGAHALVAAVLGVPFREVQVFDHPFLSGRFGRIVHDTLAPSGHGGKAPAPGGAVVRKIAMLLAGVVGTRAGDGPVRPSHFGGGGETDWERAGVLAWAIGDCTPGRSVLGDVIEALTPALRAEPWPSAIAEAADVLLTARGEPVPPEPFHEIARRHGLRLDAVEALAASAATDANGGTTDA